jgi:hypothetical protein
MTPAGPDWIVMIPSEIVLPSKPTVDAGAPAVLAPASPELLL